MTGLTDEQVKERIEAGQVNADENPNTRTYKQIVRENTLTFFNFLNLVLLVLVLSLIHILQNQTRFISPQAVPSPTTGL